jgi:hypothetical protein
MTRARSVPHFAPVLIARRLGSSPRLISSAKIFSGAFESRPEAHPRARPGATVWARLAGAGGTPSPGTATGSITGTSVGTALGTVTGSTSGTLAATVSKASSREGIPPGAAHLGDEGVGRDDERDCRPCADDRPGNAVPRTVGAVGEHRGDDTEDRLGAGEARCWSLGACLAQKHKRRRHDQAVNAQRQQPCRVGRIAVRAAQVADVGVADASSDHGDGQNSQPGQHPGESVPGDDASHSSRSLARSPPRPAAHPNADSGVARWP